MKRLLLLSLLACGGVSPEGPDYRTSQVDGFTEPAAEFDGGTPDAGTSCECHRHTRGEGHHKNHHRCD